MTDTAKRPNRRDAAKARTRQKVLEAAADLFASEGGYEAANIRAIAKAAGMSTGAVFANFADKVALYRAIYGHAPVTPEIGRGLLIHLTALMRHPADMVAVRDAETFLDRHGLPKHAAPSEAEVRS